MTRVKESRKFSFGNKILKLEDVYEIARILNTEYSKAKSEESSSTINFTVVCENGTSYESADIDIFSPKSIVNSKKPSSIQLYFLKYDSDARIRISFRKEYDSEYSENSIFVEGYDSNWVNGVLGRILERIESIEPQNPNKKLYLNLIHFASAILVGRILMAILLILPFDKPDESKMTATTLLIRHFIQANAFTFNLTIYLFGFCLGILPAFLIRGYFGKLWPYLEFQIGPAHELDESRKRAKFRNLITLIIIPLILAILYDVLKNFI